MTIRLLALLVIALIPQRPASAQAQPSQPLPGSAPVVVVATDGDALWRGRWMPPDSASARRMIRDTLAARGYGLARVVSADLVPGTVVENEAGLEGEMLRYVVEMGPLLHIGAIRIEGIGAEKAAVLLADAESESGTPFLSSRLADDARRMVRALVADGYTLAQIRIDRLDLLPVDSSLSVVLSVDLGAALTLDSIQVRGSDVRSAVAQKLIGYRVGEPLSAYDPARVRARLEASGLFASIDSVRLRVRDGRLASIVVDAQAPSPGAFDLVLGVVPDVGGGSSLVGSGFLSLLSPFGLGHRYLLRLDRQPGRTSRAEASAELPYLPWVPVGVAFGFDGIQQDSTLSTQRLRAELTYGSPAWQVFGSVSRETTKPGVGGVRLVGGRQQIAQASVTFVGGGFRADRRDRRVSPRSGLLAEVRVERGDRRRSFGLATGQVESRRREQTTQDRATASLRLFASPVHRVVLVTGGEGYLLRSDAYEVGELFRLGGTRTLRGYPDDRFRARQAVRILGETRLLLDRSSYLYLFFDAAWLDQPATSQAEVARLSGFYPGYGGGIQFETPLGLMNASYAASRESGLSDGQVHVGLSFGL